MSTYPPSSHDAARWRRVEGICDAALRLNEPERDAYLAAACGGDLQLRREVEGLLAHAKTAEGFLTAPLGAISPVPEPPRDLIGKRIADYSIVAKLGEGGMGEVYRARDERLGRDVAIKVLPAAVASDAERLKRFDREARLLAKINHPSIGAIYGLVEADGVRALVLELVDGETLSAALDRGPLKLTRALALAAQIADALDHAHRLRITHRDLKPSNIMLTASGIKLLDFGIGQWTPPDGDDGLTRPSTLTAAGAIVGTLHYMSPEQLEGRETDARSDIFAFGAVLYEMVSGAKAFDGKSQAGIIAAVLEAPAPRLTKVGGTVGARLDRIVTKCLAKHPDDRWQSARDLGDELRWLLAEVAEGKTAAPPERSSSPRRTTTIAAGVALVAAVGLIGWAANWRPSTGDESAAPIRFTIQPQEGRLVEDYFDIAADGGQIAYVAATTPTAVALHLRRLDRFDTVVLPTSGPVNSPKFSPDGQWVVFSGGGVLRKVSTKGDAPPVVLTPELSQSSLTFELKWRTNDYVWLVSRNQPIRQVSANGGQPEKITTIRPETDVDHHGPEALPSGRALLFAVHGKRNRFSIAAQDLVTGERKTIIESGFAPVYSTTGHLLFARGSAVMAVPFDERTLQIRGDPVTLVEGVETYPRGGVAQYRVSKNGTLVFMAKFPPSARQLTWVDRGGRETAIPVPAQAIESVRLSPDGDQLAFSAEDNSRRDIWVYALNSGALSRLTQDGDNWSPIWSPDGGAVIHSRDGGGSVAQVVRHRLDAAPIETLGSSEIDLWPTDLTKDDQRLIVTGQPPTDEWFISQLNQGSTVPQRLVQTPGFPRLARLSPDGRWLAYSDTVGRRPEVFIQSYAEPGQRRQVSTDGGNQVVWRRDGKELFFRNNSRMFGVSIDTTRGLQVGRPTLLVDRRYFSAWNSFDVADDGRFLMIKAAPVDDSPGQLKVVVNWLDELVKRVTVSR